MGQKKRRSSQSSEKGATKLMWVALLGTVVITTHVILFTSNEIQDSGSVSFKGNSSSYQSLAGKRTLSAGRNLLQEDDDRECREVHNIDGQDDKCMFVEEAEDCENEGAIPYTTFVYCDLGNAVWGAMIILVLWWLFCFVGLAVCADDFFCPSLVVISKTLRLSPNIAGVTFLAFGNGAPDLFSAISAFVNMKEGQAGLAVGGLFGAGIFVTTMVVGTISVVKPFKAMQRPFLRDIIFYLIAVYWTFFVLWKGGMYMAEAIGFIIFYFLYVIVVVVSGAIYKKQKAKVPTTGQVATPDNDVATQKVMMSNGNILSPEGMASPTSMSMLSFGDDTLGQINGTLELMEDDEPTKKPGAPKLQNQMSFVTFDGNPSGNANTAFSNLDETSSEQNSSMDRQESAVSNGSTNMLVSDLDVSIPTLAGGQDGDGEADDEEPLTPVRMFIDAINPINVEEWGDMKFYAKGYEIFKAPLMLVITLTCPVVNYEVEETHNWNRHLNTLHALISPTFVVLMVGVGTAEIGGVFPVYGLTLVLGAILCPLVYFTSKNEEKPKYHWAFGYMGFLCAMVWIYLIADEIVSLLETFGVVFNISNAILGLTLLAWGNSIGDLVSNTMMARQGFSRMSFAACFGAPCFNLIANSVMARQGFARMGFAACYGAPFFNLTLGLGIPLLIVMFRDDSNFVVIDMQSVQLVLSIFLLGSLVSSLVAIPLILGFKVGKFYGLYLLIFYIAFLAVAILAESGLILDGWVPPMK